MHTNGSHFKVLYALNNAVTVEFNGGNRGYLWLPHEQIAFPCVGLVKDK